MFGLFAAAECGDAKGNHEVVDVLLGHEGGEGIDLLSSAKDQEGFTALQLATIRGHGHEDIMKVQPGHVEAMFHAAIKAGHDRLVARLLDRQPELIGVVDGEDGMSPLHLAAKCGRHSIVAELFARRQPRHAAVGGKYDMNLLHFAAQYGYDTIVAELLVEQPHLIDTVAGPTGKTVLHVAVENRHSSIVDQLLAQKPELVDAKDSRGMISLFYAVSNGQNDMIELLLTHKPESIDAEDKNGTTPLYQACILSLPSTVACLLAHRPAAGMAAEMLWGALDAGKDDAEICEVLQLMCAYKPELMASEVWGDVLLHQVFGFKLALREELFSEALMMKVWQLSPPHLLHKPNRYKDTPFHVAIKTNNTFAIELVQGKLSLEEITAAYAKYNKECPLPVLLDRINNGCLLVSLHRDVVGTVWDYLGFQQPKVVKKHSQEEAFGESRTKIARF